MKHPPYTPGPWFFNQSVDLEQWLPCITTSPFEGQDNPAYYGEGLVCAFDEKFKPSKADAALITAAPTLLWYLAEMTDSLVNWAAHLPDGPRQAAEGRIKQARRLIATIEGGDHETMD